MPNNGQFWRNAGLICLVHVIAIVGLVRWSGSASKPKPTDIVWMAGDATKDPGASSGYATTAAPLSSPSPMSKEEADQDSNNHDDDDSLLLASAKSEIQLPIATPTPTPTATPAPKPEAAPVTTPLVKTSAKPSPRPPRKPRPKPTPRPTPKPTPKPRPHSLFAKASPRPAPSVEPPPDSDAQHEIAKPEKADPAADQPAVEKSAEDTPANGADAGNQSGGVSGGTGHGRGANHSSEFASYGRMLHDRFYSEWSQPTTSVASTAKMSTMVRVRIEKDGRVSRFEIVRPSGNVLVDESVEDMGKHVTQVDPPPASLRSGGHYDLKINFELNSD
ncbi:MAG: TonB C-terminal domain-containing protein [Chthoniobacterales bacterium]